MLELDLRQHNTVLHAVSINSTTLYMPILKCANTLVQDTLSANNYVKTQERSRPLVLLVTRDPIQRWISGITTYLRLWANTTNPTQLQYFLHQTLERTLTPDLHTVPQSVYVQHLEPSQILAFDTNSVDQLFKYLNIQRVSNYRNSTAEHDYMRWAHSYVLPFAQRHRSRLEETYASDYELLHSLTHC